MGFIEDENLRSKLENIIRRVREGFEPGNIGDTLQGFQHFENLDENLANLIVKTGKVNEFNDMKLFLLGASAYLHDLFKPSSAWGFLSHGGKVMKATTDKPELYGLDDRAEAIAIGWISAAHSRRNLDNTEWGRVPEKYSIGPEDVDLRKLAAFFLLADTLDTTTLRAPEMTRHIHYPEKFPDEKTEGKWMARQSITGWAIKDDRIVLKAYPMNFDEREAVLISKMMMEKDLSEVKPLLKSLGIPCELELEMQDIFLKEKAVAEIHESRPFKGMDFYGASDAELFKGREEDVGRVEDHIYAYPITLLAGSSGVGKTSLIHAGLFPKLKISGWECIYLRPFNDPSTMVESIKRSYGVEAESLAEVFRNLDEKQKKKILVVIDQFEEIMNWHAEMFEDIIPDFCSIHGLENPKLLAVLRSDALCDLNMKIFKKVMTNGFPTVELGELSREGAGEALNSGFTAGKMTLHPPELIDEILNDLIEVSPFHEIYPPYLQMVGEELCKHADERHKLIPKNTYYELGRARGILARYLVRKLDEFGVDKRKAIKILKCLVSYLGRKAQKSISEIETETGIPKKELQELLKRLVNERMIRKLNSETYEIIHDHFGELVNKEFLGEKERHIKFLKEQLNAAIAAFDRNKTLMQCQILVDLYRFRREIPIDETAYKVLLATWCDLEGPAWYWMRNTENRKIFEIAAELCEHPIEKIKTSAIDLLAKVGIKEGERQDARRFVRGLVTHEKGDVRRAAIKAIEKLGSREDLPRLSEMLKDNDRTVKTAVGKAIAKLGSREDLPRLREMLKDNDWDVKTAVGKAIAEIERRVDQTAISETQKDEMPAIRESPERRGDLSSINEMLKDKDPFVRRDAIKAILELGSGKYLSSIREKLKDENSFVRGDAIKAIAEIGSRDDLSFIGGMLKDNNWIVRGAAVDAIAEIGSRDDLLILEEVLKDEHRAVREAAVDAIAKLGSKKDLSSLRKMLKDDDPVVRRAVIKAIAELEGRDDLPLVREMLKDENWLVREAAVNAIAELGSQEDLPLIREMLKDESSYVRDVAFEAIVELVRGKDLPSIREMLKDWDLTIRGVVADAFAERGSEDDLDMLAEISTETCAVMGEPMKALGRLDWELYSPYSSSAKQE